MIFPEKLKKGDTVAIVSPSSPVTQEEAVRSKQYLESLGYQVKMGDYVYEKLGGYRASTGAVRAKNINDMFADNEVKAIFSMRGGDTSSHVVDKIDIDLVRNNPKIFVGYSDVTNLHVYFNQKADLVTYHGPMVRSNMIDKFDDFSKKSFWDALNMDDELYLENPEGEEFKVLREGKAEGILTGGNLALLSSMIGTPYEVDTKGKILFFEDINEDVPRIDRMLHQLKYSGKIDDAAGFLIGDFANSDNTADPSYTLVELLEEFFADVDKPIFYNLVAGHCFPTSTLILGATCVLDTEKKTILFKR